MLSGRGRKRGIKNRTVDARLNCTSMCMQVVNRGKWKLRCSGENIHLLY